MRTKLLPLAVLFLASCGSAPEQKQEENVVSPEMISAKGDTLSSLSDALSTLNESATTLKASIETRTAALEELKNKRMRKTEEKDSLIALATDSIGMEQASLANVKHRSDSITTISNRIRKELEVFR